MNQWECKYFQSEIKQNWNPNCSVQQSFSSQDGKKKKKKAQMEDFLLQNKIKEYRLKFLLKKD